MERRRFTRVNFETDSEVHYKGQVLPGKIKNLSLKGFYFVTAKALPVGAECELKIIIRELQPPLTLSFRSQVVRHGEDGFGAEILATDVESLSYLREILNYNLGETQTTHKELTATH